MATKLTLDTTKAIRKWLKKYGFAATCRLTRGKNAELQYDPNYNLIYVPDRYNGDLDDLFIGWLERHGLETDTDPITLSILHELGHSETVKHFTEKEWFECAALKELLYADDNLTNEETGERYWNMPDEYAANMWLIMFVKAFPEKVKELSEKIKKTLIVEE